MNPKPIKVLHLITGLRTGGAEMMLFKLLGRMDRGRVLSSVVSLSSDGTLGERIRSLGVRVHSLGLRSDRFPAAGLLRLGRILLSEGPDIVQGWMYHANALTIPVRAIVKGVRIAWNVRDDLFGEALSFSAYASHRLCAAFSRLVPDVILFNSYRSMESHRKAGYAARFMKVIYNGFDLEAFRPNHEARAYLREMLGLASAAEIVGMISRFSPSKKDHSTFLAGVSRLKALRPDVQFLLCGAGVSADNEMLMREAEKQGVRNMVHFLGERADVSRITAGLDVATLVSLVEGFPNVVGEAMACGVPVVATDVGDCRAIVGDTGLIVPPRDPEALARAWLLLLEAGPEERRRLGLRARNRVGEYYDLGKIARQYETLYEGLGRCREADPGMSRTEAFTCAESAVS